MAGVAGLWVPYTGIIDFRQVAEKYAELCARPAAEVRTDHRFLGLRRDGASWCWKRRTASCGAAT